MSSLSSIGSGNTLSNSSSPSSNNNSSSSNGLTALNNSGISIQGLISGLNTNQIIQAMLAPEQQVITNLQNQQAGIVQRESTYNTIQADLTALQSAVSGLSGTTNSVFDSRIATSSNTNVATASASSGALPGVYSFQVNSLAQAQETASQGFDSANSLITQGTFQFQVGSGAVNTITINSSNDTLQGLANAINNDNAGVTATIINDGSSSQGYRLMLTSGNSGTANAITITNNLAASSGTTLRPEFSSAYIGAAVTGSNWSGTSTPTSNAGSGSYTGSGTDPYTFTVTNGGTVGTSNGITLSYTDSTGTNTGTITLNSGDAGVLKNVAQGIQVQFNAGSLVAGNTFTINGFNPNIQAAANASLTIGSGSGAMNITSPTNQVQNVFNGLTLNLVSAAPGQTVNVTVGNDTKSETTAINNFVSAYNSVIGFINQNDSYNAQTQQGGVLLGDFQATNIINQLGSSATTAVAGVNKLANNLAGIGITVNADGTLSVNSGTLNQALSGQLNGVSSADIRHLFVQDGQSSNSGIQFVYAPNTIKAVGSPIQVQITQAATQGAATATNALAATTTVTTGSNDTFTVNVNGHVSSSIVLAAGAYTQQQLAQQVQSAINANSQLSGSQITASIDGSGHLVLTSNQYGSASQVSISSGNALSSLGFTGSESGHGHDVAGNFIVNGKSEAATGNGQILTGNSTNANTAGLVVSSSLTPAQVTPGTPEGSVTVTQGVGAQFSNTLNQMLDPVSGQLTMMQQSLQSQATTIGQAITAQQTSLQQQQSELLQEFVKMESNLAAIQSAGNTLASSLGYSTSSSNNTSNGSSSTGR